MGLVWLKVRSNAMFLYFCFLIPSSPKNSSVVVRVTRRVHQACRNSGMLKFQEHAIFENNFGCTIVVCKISKLSANMTKHCSQILHLPVILDSSFTGFLQDRGVLDV